MMSGVHLLRITSFDELEVMVAAELWMNAAELLKRLAIIAATRNRMLAVM